MKRITVLLAAGLVISVLSSGPLWGQATAQISGSVKDQSGAVLPGVEITATQTDTGIARSTVTNETGSYVLPNLALGPYKLEAALPGFRTFVQSGIVLQVNSSPAINPVLEVGQVSEQVEVQANAALVETRTQGVGQVIENARILELPLNGRNVIELISLAGGTTPGSGGGPFAPLSAGLVSVAGGLSFGLTYVLDGALNNNPYNHQVLSVPFPDALQEFKVETSATGAQNGMHSAGSVNLVTKSGTNDLHGDLFEFVRNGKFNARNIFALQRDSIKRNQFGGTVGGPLVKNKLFFFGGYQGTTIRQDPANTITNVPTAEMLAGDFTTFASPACNGGRQITLRAPFVNNRIDPAQFSKVALNVLSRFPASNDPCGKLTYGAPLSENDHMAIGKIDYQRNTNHSVFGRYLVDSAVRKPPYDITKNFLLVATQGVDSLNQAFTLGDTYLFGPNLVNGVRFAANRSALTLAFQPYQSWADLGAKITAYPPSFFILQVSGGPSISSAAGGVVTNRTGTFALNDDISLVHGNHQLAFGGSAARWQVNIHIQSLSGGLTNFNGQLVGLGYADFMTGNLAVLTQSPPSFSGGSEWYLGTYLSDTWKATRKLTVNYGVRWEPFFPSQLAYDRAYHLSLDDLRKGVRTGKYTNAPPGLTFPGDPGFPGNAGMYNQWKNFSPRLGFAWDVNGDGRTSVRASVGSFYDMIPVAFHLGTTTAAPHEPNVTVNGVRIEDPWASQPGGNPFPISLGRDARFPLLSAYAALPYDSPNPTVQQWNLSIQRQIGSDWLASASYLGTHTTHLWTVQSVNPAVYFPAASCVLNGVTYTPCSQVANINQRRRLALENPQGAGQYFGFVNTVDSGATTSYNGLVTSIERRAGRGVSINANYTWSHCIGDPYFTLINNNNFAAYTNPESRRFDRGNCTTSATDRRHVFHLTTLVETPQFSNTALRALATGWRVSPIVRIQSGGYFNVTTSADAALSGIPNQRVNQLMDNVFADKTAAKYLNPAAFAVPAAGSLGNSGAGAIRGPGYWTLDAALSRTFRFAEARRLEFRAEAFNLTNSTRLNNPVTNFNSGQFGQVTSAQDPRIMQFALKYVF